ncbi:MAG: hypothetical protein JO057_14920 [Chloroflexi bacterium]|nr:hypothetical protein [Chloroflexota bacterium]
MLVALGLQGLYARQSREAGVLGLCGTVLLFFGLVFADPIHSVLAFIVVPVLAADPSTLPLLDGPPPGLIGPLMLAVPVLLVGLVLVGIISWRATEMSPRAVR